MKNYSRKEISIIKNIQSLINSFKAIVDKNNERIAQIEEEFRKKAELAKSRMTKENEELQKKIDGNVQYLLTMFGIDINNPDTDDDVVSDTTVVEDDEPLLEDDDLKVVDEDELDAMPEEEEEDEVVDEEMEEEEEEEEFPDEEEEDALGEILDEDEDDEDDDEDEDEPDEDEDPDSPSVVATALSNDFDEDTLFAQF